MLNSIIQQLSNIVGGFNNQSRQCTLIAKNFTVCKCGVKIKCPLCKTKGLLQSLIDQSDPNFKNQERNQQKVCKHKLPDKCKKCQEKQQISSIIQQSLRQGQNICKKNRQNKYIDDIVQGSQSQ